MMATMTETKNGVQAAAMESSKATLKTFDALSGYYLAAFDAGLKLQARAIDSVKLMLDESAAFQRANRKLAEELFESARRSQEDIQTAFDTNVKAATSIWMPAEKR